MVTSIEDLTPAYLTDALGADVVAATVEPVGVGVGLIGQLYRVTPSYADGATGPVSVIAKLPGATEESRFVAMVLNMYQEECGFYRELAATSAALSPASHHVYFEDESHDFRSDRGVPARRDGAEHVPEGVRLLPRARGDERRAVAGVTPRVLRGRVARLQI